MFALPLTIRSRVALCVTRWAFCILDKKSFILFNDSLSVLDELTDEQAGKLFKAIRDFQIGKETELDFGLKMAFLPFKNQFIRDFEKYAALSESQRLKGLKSAEARANRGQPNGTDSTGGSSGQPDLTDSTYTDTDKDNDKVKDTDTDNETIIPEAELPTFDNLQKSEVEEKKKVPPKKKEWDADYAEFLSLVNKHTRRSFRGDDKSQKAFLARMKEGLTLADFDAALKSVTAIQYHKDNNFQYITPEFITRTDKLQMYMTPTAPKKEEPKWQYNPRVKPE